LNKPPEALLTAVQAYFEGNFLKTAEVDPGAMKEKHAKVQAYLFRAASRFNLYLLSGKADPNLLEQSEDDIRSIKKLNTGFSPYNEGFSPEFRDLFSKTS